MEINPNLIVNEDTLQNENVAAAMAKGFHSTILHIIRKMTDDRRNARKSHMDVVARVGYQFTNFMDQSFLQQ
eukprot:10971127-Alexandrium_andersonii.AAC.1